MTKLAYLFPTFPVFHQTFVLWEVLGIRRNGITPRIYSLRRPGAERQQPEGREVARDVTYLPAVTALPVWQANRRLLRSAPRRYLRLYAEILAAWKTGASIPTRGQGWEKGGVTLRNRLRGWFNSHPLAYLLKSWMVVPIGVYLAEQLEREGITHLHVHWASYPATVAYVVRLVTGLPFSVSAHAYDIYMVPRMLPAKVRAARFVVTCAKTNADYLRYLAGDDVAEKIIVNYHGVDVSRFAPPAAAPAHERLLIVSCGQLERYKGMHLLIDACAALHQRGVPLECCIVGEGPQRAQLEAQIDRLGVHEVVRLAGARPHAEVAELYRRADVFVLASELAGKSGRRDVIANVIVEAMAAGLPVIASRIPGVEELVEDGISGYLVPPNRVAGLTEALAKLVANPEDRRRFGAAGRRRVLRDFDNSKNVRVLADLLRGTSPQGDAATSIDHGAVRCAS